MCQSSAESIRSRLHDRCGLAYVDAVNYQGSGGTDVSHHLKNEGAGKAADAKKTTSKPAGASKASAAKKPSKSK
jgi:hypothetical protein